MLCKLTPPKAARLLLETKDKIDHFMEKGKGWPLIGAVFILWVGMHVSFAIFGVGRGQAMFYVEVFGWGLMLAFALIGASIIVAVIGGMVGIMVLCAKWEYECKNELRERAREAGWKG